MSSQSLSSRSPAPTWPAVSPGLRQAAERALPATETPIACFLSDISPHKRFEHTLLVLTPLRLLIVTAEQTREWPLEAVARVKTRDRAGLGSLELVGHDRRLGEWYYTLAQGPAALTFIDRFDELQQGRDGAPPRDEEPETPEGETHEPAPDTKALYRLIEFARPHRVAILLGFSLSMASTLAATATPYLMGEVVGQVLEPFKLGLKTQTETGPAPVFATGTALWLMACLLLATIVAWLLAWAQGAILARASERIAADLRHRTYSHLQKLSLEFFGAKRTGDLMSRIGTDSDRLCQFLSDSVVDFAADVLLIVATVVILFWLNPALALVALLPCPAVAWLMYRARDSLSVGFQASGRAWAHLNSVLADTIPGIRVVKAFAQEDREIVRFKTANDQVVGTNDRVNRIWTFFWPMIAFLNNLAILLFLAYGVYLFSQAQLELSALIAFQAYITRFYGRLEMMSRFVNASQRAAASAQRIFEVLDRTSSVPEPVRPLPIPRAVGKIEFRHVGFRYGNRKVIKDLSFAIQPGEMIGLVGHTGAGKSTLINLVCRFFDVAEGAILVDDVDIRSFSLGEYRRNIGIVLQEPFLFYGTIAENIAYGRPEATRTEIVNAARAARAHEFILNLPDAYDSLVGERGQSLSGGERQRISIARALLMDPRILILDEATSAVDTETERQIQQALATLVKGRTTIAIAHRLSTLRQANRIMVIDRGRLVEIGRHEELLSLPNGHYAALVKAQQELTKDIGW